MDRRSDELEAIKDELDEYRQKLNNAGDPTEWKAKCEEAQKQCK